MGRLDCQKNVSILAVSISNIIARAECFDFHCVYVHVILKLTVLVIEYISNIEWNSIFNTKKSSIKILPVEKL